jgi:c-di-GMP-binding flagellar brake protein YcgR
MDTRPMPLGEVAAQHGGLDDFRLTTPGEISVMLKRLIDGNVPVALNSPDGSAITTTLWTLDSARGIVSFSANAADPALAALIECDEAVVVAYLDSVKLQFDVNELVLVHGGHASALNCAFPREMFRFQRRSGFRVRPLVRSSPVARLRHPMIPDMQLTLRVLDVSIGGCALFIPDDVPPLPPGVQMNGVEIDLDADTRVRCGLRLQHVTSINPESRGVRLGCEMINTGSDGLRALQRYIDQTQKRRKLMALE